MIEISSRYYSIDMGTPPIDYLVAAGIPVDAVKGFLPRICMATTQAMGEIPVKMAYDGSVVTL